MHPKNARTLSSPLQHMLYVTHSGILTLTTAYSALFVGWQHVCGSVIQMEDRHNHQLPLSSEINCHDSSYVTPVFSLLRLLSDLT